MTWAFKGLLKRGLELHDGTAVAVAPAGRARLRYNAAADDLELSTNGSAYAALGDPSDIDIPDNDATAFRVHQGANDYIVVSTVNAAEEITLGSTSIDPTITLRGTLVQTGLHNQTSVIYLGDLDINNEVPASGTAQATWTFSRVIPQPGEQDDLVVAGGINYYANGSSINPLLPAIAWQFENYYRVPGPGGRRVIECHFGEYRPIGGSGPNNRRWLSCQIDVDTHVINGGVRGTFDFQDSAGLELQARMSETGQLQLKQLYFTLSNASLLVAQKVGGGAMTLLQSDGGDLCTLNLGSGAVVATDGRINMGEVASIKAKLTNGDNFPLIAWASNTMQIGDGAPTLAGINVTVPTGGSGFSVYLGSAQTLQPLQVAFDGLYLAKTAGAKMSMYGVPPVVQHTTTGQTAGFTAGAGTAVLSDSTFTGGVGSKAYTLGDIVRALKNLGAIASS